MFINYRVEVQYNITLKTLNILCSSGKPSLLSFSVVQCNLEISSLSGTVNCADNTQPTQDCFGKHNKKHALSPQTTKNRNYTHECIGTRCQHDVVAQSNNTINVCMNTHTHSVTPLAVQPIASHRLYPRFFYLFCNILNEREELQTPGSYCFKQNERQILLW